MHTHALSDWYQKYHETTLTGRYITLQHIAPLLKNLPAIFQLQQLGNSVQGRSIESVTFGNGHKKILMWSQMHGNESTTTKAVFDLLNFIKSHSETAKSMLNNCTICIIPILNPDGAHAYTRVNANKIDLNRDAQNLSQPESNILRKLYNEFQPDYCFNLHGQRTIFSVGNTDKSSILSFLTPSEDQHRSITLNRRKGMEIIVQMNQMLQQLIPNHVARYDDSFNINCVGDTFQADGTPTILFEAGHYPQDYQREKTRELLFYALIEAIQYINTKKITGTKTDAYFAIPENEKNHYDMILKNVQTNQNEEFDLGIMYKEILHKGKIKFEPYIEDRKLLKKSFAHKIIDFQKLNAQTYRFQSFSLEIEVKEFLRKFNKIDN